MEDRDLALMTAIILGGIIGGERTSADDKTLKRAVEIAKKLKVILEGGDVLPSDPIAPPV